MNEAQTPRSSFHARPGQRDRHILDTLLQQLPALRRAVLVDDGGNAIAMAGTGADDARELCATAQLMFSKGAAVVSDRGLGANGRIVVESENGKLILIEVARESGSAVLALLADPTAVTGTVLWAAREYGQALAKTVPAA